MKLALKTNLELEHFVELSLERYRHHRLEENIAIDFLARAKDYYTMAKFYRLAQYHAKRAEFHKNNAENFSKMLRVERDEEQC